MEERQGEAGKADSNLSDDIKCGIQGVTHQKKGKKRKF